MKSRSITAFLLRIKHILDSLNATGDPISYTEQIDIILEGLPNEYEALVNLIYMHSKFQPLSIDEIEELLLAQEVRIERSRKSTITKFKKKYIQCICLAPLTLSFRLCLYSECMYLSTSFQLLS